MSFNNIDTSVLRLLGRFVLVAHKTNASLLFYAYTRHFVRPWKNKSYIEVVYTMPGVSNNRCAFVECFHTSDVNIFLEIGL